MLALLSQITLRDLLVSGGTLVLAGLIALPLNLIENRQIASQATKIERAVWKEAVNKLNLLLEAEREAAQAKLDDIAKQNEVTRQRYEQDLNQLRSDWAKEIEGYEKDLADARKSNSRIIIPHSMRDRINAAGR